MIDQNARDRLALALRQLASGQLTVDEFDSLEEELAIDDPAVYEAWLIGWTLYDDFWSGRTRLRGKYAIAREERRLVARVILFLKSNRKYAYDERMRQFLGIYPPPSNLEVAIAFLVAVTTVVCVFALMCWWIACVLAVPVAAFAFMAVLVTRRNPEEHLRVEFTHPESAQRMDPWDSFWPFANETEFEEALRDPPFLTGRPRRLATT